MANDKRTGKVIVTIGLLGLIAAISFWVLYASSLTKANTEASVRACIENKEQAFQGQLVEVNKFEDDNFMYGRFFNLHIKTNDSLNYTIDYHYNLPQNKELLDFAKKGQIATKIKGADTFTLGDINGVSKVFKIAKCTK
jgi:hypothetical protein